MEPICKPTLDLTYRGIVYSKKNNKNIVVNRRTGRPQIISNQRVREMEAAMAREFQAQAAKAKWEANADTTYEVSIFIWTKDRTRRDLDNQATSILDALVAAGVIPDDSMKYVISLQVEFMGVDKNDPRAEVTVRKEEDDDEES